MELLEAYRFAADNDTCAFSFRAAELLRADKLNGILLSIQERLQAPDLKVTASMLMKRYGFYVAINMFSMSVLNKKINGSIENITFRETRETGFIPDIVYKDITASHLPSDRVKGREEVCRETFAEHLFPILEVLSKETKLPKQIMWENIAIYLFWLYENLLETYKGQTKAAMIESDFRYLVFEASGSIFGKINANPFQRYYTEKILLPEKDYPVRVRQTCCFSYKLGTKNTMCGGCPRSCRKLERLIP